MVIFIIIVCGNELNYKTTVANKLSRKLNLDLVKGSSFELSRCTQQELFDSFMNIANMDLSIVDRFYPSNRVYAQLYPNFPLISLEQIREIEEVLKEKKSFIVYLYAPTEILKQRLRKRGDEYVEEDKLHEINEKYKYVMKNEVGIDIFSYNTELLSSDEIVNMICSKIYRFPFFQED